MKPKHLLQFTKRNFLFWLSRKIDYPLVPPDVVQVNFTFRCNLRCKMCSMYDQMEFLKSQGKQVEIEKDTFRKVIKESKELGAKAILFIGGEPFLNKDLFELIEYARTLGLGTVIVTNGVLLHEENIRKCMQTGVDWLSISIDAASEGGFSKIRGQDVFGKIVHNITMLNDFRRKGKNRSPKTVAVCTIMDDNLEDIMNVVQLCKDLEIERVLFQPVVAHNIDQTHRDGNSPGFVPPQRLDVLDKVIDNLLEYKKKSLSNFDFIGNSTRHLRLIKKYFRGSVKHRELPCYAGYNRVQIVQEGKIYFCVNQEQFEANYGDIRKDSLKDLWYSQEARSYRKLIRKCKVPCLQWCSYRDEFTALAEIFQKAFLFRKVS